MIDELHQNYGAMTGTPTLVAGATSDSDQALSFDGSTNSMSVPDSVSDSLAVADGAAGGMTLGVFFKLPSIPGSTKTIIGKTGSWVLEVNSSGKLLWTVTNGANTVTVTSAMTLTANVFYHVVCVYNGDYTGTPLFGYNTQGAAQLAMTGDYLAGSSTGATDNLFVAKYPILEKGLITSLVADIQRVHDATLNEWMAPVVFRASGGEPAVLVDQGDPINLSDAVVSGRAWVPFPCSAPAFAGDIYLGLVGGSNGSQFRIGHETSGGTRRARAASVTDATSFQLTGNVSNPFGTATVSDSKKLSIYANYTPTGRTGAEGKALIYINGQQDAASAYAHGIADSANAISFATSVAVHLDEPAIWARKLTPVEIAYLYSAR